MAPTGKAIEIKGISIFRFSPEGKVVESWDAFDQLSLMRQSIEHELSSGTKHPVGLTPQEGARIRGLGGRSLLPTG